MLEHFIKQKPILKKAKNLNKSFSKKGIKCMVVTWKYNHTGH